ncbi:MAG: FemAB family XrtA/PEP-CTERM system-associated protein [Rhizomicrobium sp.]
MKEAKILPHGAEGAWDDFVKKAPGGTFFHLSSWRGVLEEAFGHRTYYLFTEVDGSINGVLPLTQVKSLLFGNTLISNAFCVEGGILAENAQTAEVLRRGCVNLARKLNVDGVELRSANWDDPEWVRKEGLYVSFRRPITTDEDANLKAIPRKQRAMVRKGISLGLTSEIDFGVDRLHHIYAQSVHHLGTPVFPKKYFRMLKSAFRDDCDIVTVVHNGEAVASVLNFYFRDQVLPYYGGGTLAARQLAANDFMYWEVMRRAAERGYRIFDFGRSKTDTGAFHFKKNWGFEPQPLTYEFLPVARQEIPDVNPLNPKYQMMISMWRRLPLAATKVLGPMIVRSIG